jgi:signal transduction histidine kinase
LHTVDLAIRDYGPGIPESRLTKLFQPYYTTKSGPDETGRGGTGLGLYACRQIIEAHRGRIRVESTVGQGTCFIIKLPVAALATSAPTGGAVLSAAQTPLARS